LGIKRFGTVPTNFPGKPSGGSGIAEHKDPLLPSFDELHITDVSETGTMVGFTKSEMEGSWSFQSTPGYRERPEVFGAEAYVQRISENGIRWGVEQAFMPSGQVVALPEGHKFLPGWYSAVTPNGQILLDSNEVWDPADTSMSYPVGMGFPYGGKVRSLKNVPEGASASACNSKGEILYLSAPDRNRRVTFWIGKIDESPVKGEALLDYGYVELGEDGKVYTVSAQIIDKRPSSLIYRAGLTGKLESLLSEPLPKYVSLVSALPDGTVYGSFSEPMEGQERMMEKRGAFVLRSGDAVVLDPILGPGYSISLRRINNRGAICARITQLGAPVMVVPNLYDLLNKERALSRKRSK
jgi:hypothetical protein